MMYIKIQASPNRGEDGNRGPTDPELQPIKMKCETIKKVRNSSITQQNFEDFHAEMWKFVARQRGRGAVEMVSDLMKIKILLKKKFNLSWNFRFRPNRGRWIQIFRSRNEIREE